MEYRFFGDTDIRCSEVGVGCGQLGDPAKADLPDAIRRAVELGVNLFDSADSYHGGRSETILGQTLADFDRDDLVLATKFGTVIPPGGKAFQDHSVTHMARQLEQSLSRLQTDRIDIYQVHTPRWPCIEDQELWATLDRLVEQGKIRAYGLSVDQPEMAEAFLDCANGRGLQLKLNLFNQEFRPMLTELERRGVGVLVKVPMAGGSLTDRFGPDWPAPDDDRRQRWGEENFAERVRLAEQIRPIVTRDGLTMAQGALAWLLTVSKNTIPIPGLSSVGRLEETAAAAGARLDDDQMDALDMIDDGLLPTLAFGW